MELKNEFNFEEGIFIDENEPINPIQEKLSFYASDKSILCKPFDWYSPSLANGVSYYFSIGVQKPKGNDHNNRYLIVNHEKTKYIIIFIRS